MVGVLRKGGICKGIIDELTRKRIFNRQNYPFGMPSIHHILKKTA